MLLRISRTPQPTNGLYLVEKYSHIGELSARYELDSVRLNALKQQCADQHIPIEYVDIASANTNVVAEPTPFDASDTFSMLGDPSAYVPTAPPTGNAIDTVRMPFRHGGGGESYVPPTTSAHPNESVTSSLAAAQDPNC